MTCHVTVGLGERSYPIHIGGKLLEQAGEHIARATTAKRVCIVTDANVAGLHLPRLTASLDSVGIAYHTVTVAPGEGTKNWATLGETLSALLDAAPDRKTPVIALGGGVVGDLAGFAASILLRGVPFVQIPTTLLSQVDSSVGGKTGVNAAQGKNLLGSFYQPRLVLADLDTLATLPAREMRAGYAEVVKYGVIDQPEFFAWLEANHAAVLSGDADALAYAVKVSCEAKAAVVGADEREGGVRALLNLGHTFGHALEAEAGYDGTLLHGEAVAIGMVLALDLSARLGHCTLGERDRLIRHLRACGLPASPRDIRPQWDVERLVKHLYHDKKTEGGKLTFILAHGIGKSFIAKDVDPEPVRATFADAVRG